MHFKWGGPVNRHSQKLITYIIKLYLGWKKESFLLSSSDGKGKKTKVADHFKELFFYVINIYLVYQADIAQSRMLCFSEVWGEWGDWGGSCPFEILLSSHLWTPRRSRVARFNPGIRDRSQVFR